MYVVYVFIYPCIIIKWVNVSLSIRFFYQLTCSFQIICGNDDNENSNFKNFALVTHRKQVFDIKQCDNERKPH